MGNILSQCARRKRKLEHLSHQEHSMKAPSFSPPLQRSKMIIKRADILIRSDRLTDLSKLRKNGEKRVTDIRRSTTTRWCKLRQVQPKSTVFGQSSHLCIVYREYDLNCTNSNLQEAKGLYSRLASHNRPSELQLSINLTNDTYRYIEPVSSMLKKLARLKTATINLCEMFDLWTKSPTSSIFKNVRYMHALQSLTLQFDDIQQQDDDLRTFFLSANRLPMLSCLKLSFIGSLFDSPIPPELPFWLSRLSRLSTLVIRYPMIEDVSNTENNHEINPITNMAKMIVELNSLTSISVSLSAICSTNHLISRLNKMKNLTAIHLELRFEKISSYYNESSIYELLRILVQLRPLESIFLKLNDLEAVQIAFKTFSKHLTLLTQLPIQSLKITTDQAIDKQDVGNIVRTLSGMNSLKSFEIYASEKELTDKMAIKILTSLSSHSALGNLTVRFYGCEFVGNETVSSLASICRQLVSLKALNVQIQGPKIISREVLKKLADETVNLRMLSSLKLSFTCETWSDQEDEQQQFMKQLQNMTAVEKEVKFTVWRDSVYFE